MSLEISGKVVSKLQQQTGQGRNGAWVKQDFIIETQEQFPKKVCVALWGDKVKELEQYAIGDSIKVSINIESREFNGRWYTDIKAWRMEREGASAPQGGGNIPNMTPLPNEVPPFVDSMQEPTDDLPF